MENYKPNYNKDRDLAGYLYLHDSDVLEEELKFEELLKKVGGNMSRGLRSTSRAQSS